MSHLSSTDQTVQIHVIPGQQDTCALLDCFIMAYFFSNTALIGIYNLKYFLAELSAHSTNDAVLSDSLKQKVCHLAS